MRDAHGPRFCWGDPEAVGFCLSKHSLWDLPGNSPTAASPAGEGTVVEGGAGREQPPTSLGGDHHPLAQEVKPGASARGPGRAFLLRPRQVASEQP